MSWVGRSLWALSLAAGTLCWPGLARAQMGAGNGHNNDTEHHTLDPHIADLIRASNPNDPTSFILVARPDLNLTDSEVTAMYRVRMEMLSGQQAARNALDTLGPNQKLSSIDFAHITPAGRDSIIAHRKAVADANNQIHDVAIVAQQKVLAILTQEQRSRLIDLQKHVQEEERLPHDSIDAEKVSAKRH